MSTDKLLHGDFQPIIERFVTRFPALGKGSLTADMAEFSSGFISLLSRGKGGNGPETFASISLRDALQRWAIWQPGSWRFNSPGIVRYRTNIDIFGTTYRPSHVALGDSYILVGTEEDWRPAQIRSIFSIECCCNDKEEEITLLSISGFRPLSQLDIVYDMYRPFPLAGGRIYYREELPEEVIGQNEVLSHFAYTPDVCKQILAEHFHALPLTRVRSFSLGFALELTL